MEKIRRAINNEDNIYDSTESLPEVRSNRDYGKVENVKKVSV